MSYLLAQLGPQEMYGTSGTLLVMAAGLLPDLDGVSILAGWQAHLKYHRKVGHGLPLMVLGPLGLALAWAAVQDGTAQWPALWAWLQLSFVLHLTVDLLFYRWPVQLLWPLSSWGIGLGLIRWNDLVPTLVLYAATAVALVFPSAAVPAACAGLGLLTLYIGWRAVRREQPRGWLGWLAGGWVQGTSRVWRWLTGDFVT